MSSGVRLILFDVDGTLVDSQADIVGAMNAAFDGLQLIAPDRAAILSIVGLSLDQAMAQLAPDHSLERRNALVANYKQAYNAQTVAKGPEGSAPLYPGARAVLEQLAHIPDVLLGVATGKSKRGLDALLSAHALEQFFVTRQVADHHPSKPHPSMITTAMRETGVDAVDTVMIGDTSYDMDMARAAGVGAIGVSWGYHARPALRAAHHIIDSWAALPNKLDTIWKTPA